MHSYHYYWMSVYGFGSVAVGIRLIVITNNLFYWFIDKFALFYNILVCFQLNIGIEQIKFTWTGLFMKKSYETIFIQVLQISSICHSQKNHLAKTFVVENGTKQITQSSIVLSHNKGINLIKPS